MTDVIGDDAGQLLPLQVLPENRLTGLPGTGQTDITETEMRDIQPDIPTPAGQNQEKFQDDQGQETIEGQVIMDGGEDQLILTRLINFHCFYCTYDIYPHSMNYFNIIQCNSKREVIF